MITIFRKLTAALAVLGLAAVLATPSASAAVVLSYTVNGGGSNPLTNNVSTSGTAGTIGYTLTATAFDVPAFGQLSTTTIDINNAGSGTATITFHILGDGFTFGGTAYTGQGITTNESLTANPGALHGASDSVSGFSVVQTTTLPTISGASTGGGGAYILSPVGSGVQTALQNVTLANPYVNIDQCLVITLGAFHSGSFTITTNLFPTPEPSSMAIAGLGTLGLIGYGIRRRRSA